MRETTLRGHGLRIGPLEDRLVEPPRPRRQGDGRGARARELRHCSRLDPLFAAVVEATEEAVLNPLWAAVDTTGREGRLVRALPHEPVLALLREHGRLQTRTTG